MSDPSGVTDSANDNPSLPKDVIDSEDEITKASKPRVLTRASIPTITQGLDASDVLECYTLLRSVPLHGMANSTLHIQKPALGFRYRPPGGTGTAIQNKPLEITLEYGPQRVGTALDRDATPLAQVQDGSAILTWDNESRVYYTTKIVSERYISSYYMASMTGTVLEKMLAKAVEFAEERRKYQPFSVYSPANDKLLKSSSSQDFTNYIWKELAYLGVEIEPILPPPSYEPRLWAKSVTKIIPEGKVGYDAAMFYSQLYQCLTAIALNDYTPYIPTARPSVSSSPSIMPSNAPSRKPTVSESPTVFPTVSMIPTEVTDPVDSSNNTTSNVNKVDDKHGESSNTDDEETKDEDNRDGAEDDDDKLGDEDENDVSDLNAGNHTRRRMDTEFDPATSIDDPGNDDFEVIDGEDEELDLKPSAKPSAQPSTSAAPSSFPSQMPSLVPLDPAQDAAKKATNAMEKAENAMVAQAAMDGLLSGDGDSMAAIITSNCLMDPQYGIAAIDQDGNVTAHVYLYRDGSLYWKLDLVHPYFTVEKVNRPLPKPADLSNNGVGGDLIDWVLALLVMSMVLVGIVMIIQQMNTKISDRLYILQRWFFNPTKYDYEGDLLVTDSNELGEDGVPISMGGRRATTTTRYRDSPSSKSNDDPSDDDDDNDIVESNGDVEMRNLSSVHSGSLQRMRSGESLDMRSRGSADDDEIAARIRLRNPDLVDLPSLSSTSKVATPVGKSDDFFAS